MDYLGGGEGRGQRVCWRPSQIIRKLFANYTVIVYAHGRRLCSNWF